MLRETMESLDEVERLFTEGVVAAGEAARIVGSETISANSGQKFSFIGETKDGRPCYVSGFDDSVNMDERIKVFKDRIATIFNLGAVELKTDVKKIRILGDRFTAQKNIYGDSHNTPKEQAAKISSLYDLADILATATYDPTATNTEDSYANPNVKPKNKAHENVKYWYKFKNEIVFDGVPYTVTFNIRDKGKEQYQYLIEFKENKTPGLSNTAVKSLLRTNRMSYEDSIAQTSDSVNRKFSISEENVSEEGENPDVSENVGDKAMTWDEAFGNAVTGSSFRQALAEALEKTVKTDSEYKILKDYSDNIAVLNNRQKQIDELTATAISLREKQFYSPSKEERSAAAKCTTATPESKSKNTPIFILCFLELCVIIRKSKW